MTTATIEKPSFIDMLNAHLQTSKTGMCVICGKPTETQFDTRRGGRLYCHDLNEIDAINGVACKAKLHRMYNGY